MHLNTLLLARQLLGEKTILLSASREEIVAVLDARDELDAAIELAQRAIADAEAQRNDKPPTSEADQSAA